MEEVLWFESTVPGHDGASSSEPILYTTTAPLMPSPQVPLTRAPPSHHTHGARATVQMARGRGGARHGIVHYSSTHPAGRPQQTTQGRGGRGRSSPRNDDFMFLNAGGGGRGRSSPRNDDFMPLNAGGGGRRKRKHPGKNGAPQHPPPGARYRSPFFAGGDGLSDSDDSDSSLDAAFDDYIANLRETGETLDVPISVGEALALDSMMDDDHVLDERDDGASSPTESDLGDLYGIDGDDEADGSSELDEAYDTDADVGQMDVDELASTPGAFGSPSLAAVDSEDGGRASVDEDSDVSDDSEDDDSDSSDDSIADFASYLDDLILQGELSGDSADDEPQQRTDALSEYRRAISRVMLSGSQGQRTRRDEAAIFRAVQTGDFGDMPSRHARRAAKEAERIARKEAKAARKAKKRDGRDKNALDQAALKINESIALFVRDPGITQIPLSREFSARCYRSHVAALCAVYRLSAKTTGGGKRRQVVISRTPQTRAPPPDVLNEALRRLGAHEPTRDSDRDRTRSRTGSPRTPQQQQQFGGRGGRGGNSGGRGGRGGSGGRGGRGARYSGERGERGQQRPSPATPASPRVGEVVGGNAPVISDDNVGNRMLRMMGWSPGDGLGARGTGIVEPVQAVVRGRRAGLGM